MEISTKEMKRVALVTVGGRIDHETSPELEETLQKLIDDGKFNLVIDLEDVEYISSRGLRALLGARKTVRRWNRGDVRLANPQDYIRETFDLVGFTQLFEMYDDLAEAVGSF
ncbi:MAG: STAS domain-containing protein [Anaerolineae bacterium]